MVTFSEWDIGMENRVFNNSMSLIASLNLKGTDYSLQEALDEGLLEITEIQIEGI